MLQNHEECLLYLEKIRWNGAPTCPYCSSQKASAYKKEQRYHCHNCFTSYSVMVGTIFHKTHVDLRKWFQAIIILHKLNGNISGRQLAKEVGISRAAAASIMDRVLTAAEQDDNILDAIKRDYNH
jgi:transposase-like protein